MTYPYYVPYFHQILLDTGKVYVDGIGTFFLEKTSAAFTNNKSLISPPVSHISFKNGIYDGFSLSEALSESGVDQNLATRIEHSFTNDYKESVSNKVPFDIMPLAMVQNGAFTNVNTKLFNKYEGLRNIETSVLSHDVERSYVQKTKMSYVPIQINPTAQYRSSWKDYLIPLLIIFSLISVITIWYDSSKMLIPKSEMQAQYATKPLIVKAAAASKSTEQMLSEVDSILKKSNEIKDAKVPAKVDITPVNPKTFNREGTIVDQKPVIKVNKAQKKHIGSSTESKGETTRSNNGSCVIIVGSFKNSANASNLIKKLSQKGYKTYSENNNGLQRVGITYNCSEKDSEVFKNEIRQSLNPDAWKLKDSI